MTTLVTDNRFLDPDRAYRALIEAHRGLSDEASAALNSRLVLILANHIGDQAVLQEALALATKSMVQPEDASS
jgi:predicted metal-dependent hydrolase